MIVDIMKAAIVVFLLVLLIVTHEIGHKVAFRILGLKSRITWFARDGIRCGSVCTSEEYEDGMTPLKEVFMSSAGGLFSALVFGCMMFLPFFYSLWFFAYSATESLAIWSSIPIEGQVAVWDIFSGLMRLSWPLMPLFLWVSLLYVVWEVGMCVRNLRRKSK